MKIKSIEAVELAIPRRAPSVTPRRKSWNDYAPRGLPLNQHADFPPGLPGEMPGISSKIVWVRVTAEDGTWGLGRCMLGDTAASYIHELYAPLLVGRDCLATDFLNDLMWRSTKRHGSLGLSAIVQSGVDLALWDLKGKLLSQPVYRLLGGPSRNHIDCYCTSDDLDWAIELGFRAFKISNPVHYSQGAEGLKLVEEKVSNAREVVGPDVDLMINPVMSYNVDFTIRLAERLRPYSLRWLEEPLPPEDIEGYKQIKQAIPWMPIAAGEDHHTRIAFRQLVENRCVDVVQPDLSWCGGLSEAIRIYHIAEAAGITSSPHAGCNTPFGQHFLLAFPEVQLGEFHMSSPVGVPLEEVVSIPGMALPREGRITPNDAPGFGIEIEEAWIKPYRFGSREDVQSFM